LHFQCSRLCWCRLGRADGMGWQWCEGDQEWGEGTIEEF
jgi:hypothetical protein